MKKLTLPLVVVLVAALLVSMALARPMPSDPGAEKAAVQASQAWLTHVDGQDYAASWDAAAPVFQDAITKEGWTKAVSAVRGPLGAVTSRTLKSATYTESLPGAPDGAYVVVLFETTFANKAAAVETVVPMQVDGAWKVSGYFVK